MLPKGGKSGAWCRDADDFLEIICDHPRFGPGLPSDRLDTVLLNQTATTLVNEGVGLSGVITSGTRFGASLADLFRRCYAYPVFGVVGKFGIRLVRGPAGGEPTFEESDLAEEIAKRVATYQNGSPTTIIGPPTSGARVLNEFWRDALGGEWVCTVAGTPGTWIQIRPAAVTADPASGTIPKGYLVWNVIDGAVKRHAGSYSWEITVGANASAKVGFHGATPTAQRAGAAQAAVTYASQTVSDPPTRAQVQAVNDGLVAAITLLNELRAGVVEKGLIKGGV